MDKTKVTYEFTSPKCRVITETSGSRIAVYQKSSTIVSGANSQEEALTTKIEFAAQAAPIDPNLPPPALNLAFQNVDNHAEFAEFSENLRKAQLEPNKYGVELSLKIFEVGG